MLAGSTTMPARGVGLQAAGPSPSWPSPDRQGRAGTLSSLQGNFVGANKPRHLGRACQPPKDRPADSCKEQEEGEVC